MAASYEIKLAQDQSYYFNLKAANGEIVLTSPMYRSHRAAKQAINGVRKWGPDCLMYDMKMDRQGQYYFLLKSANRRTLGRSESYTRMASMEKGIQAVMRYSEEATVQDLTQ